MQSTMSLVINLLLLAGIVLAIYLQLSKNKQRPSKNKEPKVGNIQDVSCDDIISVRKVTDEPSAQQTQSQPVSHQQASHKKQASTTPQPAAFEGGRLLVMYLFAGKGKQFVGYELLQALLSSGMRFGEMNIFHRHQFDNGRGPVLFSLASASEPGTFELQKMGAYSGSGLCLFMRLSENSTIDSERFKLMLETGHQICKDLDGVLLDDKRQPMSEQSIAKYQRLMNAEPMSA